MITTEFYDGQGFGNQLWSYATLRCLSVKLGFAYGIQSPQRFKGLNFLHLDMGRKVIGKPNSGPNSKLLPMGVKNYFREDKVIQTPEKFEITPFDKRILLISDKTKIDGYFQSELLIKEFRDQIISWFKINKNVDVNYFDCIINIRGGEYAAHPTLFLNKIYYENAIKNFQKLTKNPKFAIVTDDIDLARKLLPKVPIISREVPYSRKTSTLKILEDFSYLQNARNLILSNSSFSWWGAWTNPNRFKIVIAPKYWARHNANAKYWSLGDSLTDEWLWQDTHGILQEYHNCLIEKVEFEKSRDYIDSLSLTSFVQ